MLRSIVVACAIITTLVSLLPATSNNAYSSDGSAFSVTHPKLRHYWDHRGGIRVLGNPISRQFLLLGTEVQILQYGVIQHRINADWGLGLMNILDEDMLPYTHIGGLTLPSPDPELTNAAPPINDPDYAEKAIAFVKAHVPDEWDGLNINFYSTFNIVTYREAFPTGDADPSQLPLINLEMWGLPVSKPTYDPRNHDFIYQRFQRGILHFDRGSGETKWLPVGEYLKALITGRNLPEDLRQEAKGNMLYLQYDNTRPNGLANPSLLPNTDLFAAFEEDGVVVPTPVPPTPIPEPTAVPESLSKPDHVEIEGSEWFKYQTSCALGMLPENTGDYIHKVIEVNDYSRFDIPNRILYVTERDAFAPSYREIRDAQILWYAGWIAHSLVHAEQYWSSRPSTGLEAEREAWMRQKDFLLTHDCDCVEGQFVRRMTEVINRSKLEYFGEWAQP